MKNKWVLFFIRISSALLAGFIMIFIHDYGRYLYIKNFQPVSHGVTLGFVAFYILYIMMPSLFVMSLVSRGLFLSIYCVVSILLIFLWFTGNPLRVSLMLMAYTVASLCLFFMTRYLDKKSIPIP